MIIERPMIEFLIKFLLVVRSRLKSRARLEAENIVLRQQMIVLSRRARSRARLKKIDRLILIWMYRIFPTITLEPLGHPRSALWTLSCI
jgi:hypothetical protein